ncbi:MAG: universal stress protein [Pseudomonadota bacterium]
MRKVLLPVDGSDSAFQAALYLIDFARRHGPVEIHVVNVQPKPVEWQTHGMEKQAINDHLAFDAHLVMKAVLHVLTEGEIPYQTHVKLGDPAYLEAGNVVPADLRLIDSAELEINKAALTGESVGVQKLTTALPAETAALGDRLNIAFKGT